jgi:hypothetical protein
MPDRDDNIDPMDEAYLRAEQALDDETERTARRARVLAAVAQEAATSAAPEPSVQRPVRRYGGWLAAACIAGLSVWTAGQVYRLSPRRQESTPPVLQPPTPPAAKAPAPPAPQALAAPPTVVARARPQPIVPIAPTVPPPDIAPPPPLPIPPVEKPLQATPPPPLPIPPVEKPIAPPATFAAPAVAAKSGLAAADAPRQEVQSVVVTGSRIARRDYAASTAVNSDVSQARMVAETARLRAAAARLHYDAVAGRTDDIETTLAQGVPVDAVDQDGETALMKCIEAGQREAAALLRRHGASLDVKNLVGVSARDMAAAKHDPELDQALGITPSAATPP